MLEKGKLNTVDIDELLAILDAMAKQTPKELYMALIATSVSEFCKKNNMTFTDFSFQLCMSMYVGSSESYEEARLHMLVDMAEHMSSTSDIDEDDDSDENEDSIYGNYFK